jgi:hypothetical protein
MGRLRPADWTAIKWYMKEHTYTIKDLMVWPFVRFRNNSNEIVDVDITHIKIKYTNRPRKKSVNKGA